MTTAASRPTSAHSSITLPTHGAAKATTSEGFHEKEGSSSHGSHDPVDVERLAAAGVAGESAIPEDKEQEIQEKLEDAKLHDGWETDPENPRNWTPTKKWTATCIVSFYSLLAPLTSSMMAPALPDVAEYYNIEDDTIISLTLSIFQLLFAVGLLIFAPLSEMYGRTWPLHIANICCIAFNLGCAFSPDTNTLLVMRLFSGLFSSASIAIGGGSVSDLFAAEERALAMSLYSMGFLLGPALGPVAGGFVSQYVGLKWVFIIMAAMGGLLGAISIPLLRETYAPVLRIRRAKKAGKLEEFLASHPHFASAHSGNLAQVLWINIKRPSVLLFRSSLLFLLGLYMAFLYGLYYLMFATFSSLFGDIYGFQPGIGGLVYLGLGLGFLAATFVAPSLSDGIYKRLAHRHGRSKPEHRLPMIFLSSLIIPIGLFWYGWSAQARLHWIMPIIGTAIYGFAQVLIYLAIQLYLAETFTFAASALSAAAVFRSLFGFAMPLFSRQMFDTLGVGPGNSLLAGIAIVLGIPFPIWIYFKGEEMRKRNKYTR